MRYQCSAIKDPYIRDEIEKSGRQEITLSMVIRGLDKYRLAWNRQMAKYAQAAVTTEQLGKYAQSQAAALGSPFFDQSLMYLLGGLFSGLFGGRRCPCCGR